MLSYRRDIHLPRLIRLPTASAGETEQIVGERIIARLKSALRQERTRARAGCRSYNLNKHIALRTALAAEGRRLEAMRKAQRRR
ncbi:DUF6477 family protein [Afifella pfennigii]|uniref:DUF6477 family protein n=1 Tax=Afifella pfennigii TaxID=209897 RepID=UPI00054F1F86|nr:DUF6477 family protein [Afifella pfennigii]